jgi:hypothetical protein
MKVPRNRAKLNPAPIASRDILGFWTPFSPISDPFCDFITRHS